MWRLSILLTTIGRPSLKRMLDSLVSQLTSNDHLYIAIDGPLYHQLAQQIINQFSGRWQCQVTVFEHPINVGYWGHDLRNLYQRQMEGDYLLHADDDDVYIEGAIDTIKNSITEAGQLYIFQMYRPFHDTKIIPARDEIAKGNIGSPCGVVANQPELFGQWGNHYDGDSEFWIKTGTNFSSDRIHFVHKIIYLVLGSNEI